jgi:hypothetical protein
MRISFKPLVNIGATHAFHGGGALALDFVLPQTARSMLAGARTLARMVDGRLVLAYEADAGGAPIASLAGRSLLIGVKPGDGAFERYTERPLADASAWPLYENRSAPGTLDAPAAVQLVGTGEPAPNTVIDRELALAAPWGLLRLHVDAALYAAPAQLTIALAARSETLRYYVVAQRYGSAEFDQIQVVDSGFQDDARPQVQFSRLLPAAFGSQHLAPALLDTAGSARIALFESTAPVTRRSQAPRRLQLKRNGDVLVEHLPLPGAARADAQFIVHLSKPS